MTKNSKNALNRAKNDKNAHFWRKSYKNSQNMLEIAFFDEKCHLLALIPSLSNLVRFYAIVRNSRLPKGLKYGRVLFTEKAHQKGEQCKFVISYLYIIKPKGSRTS